MLGHLITMRILDIKIRQISGNFKYSGILWRERPGRPLDLYPPYRAQNANDTIGRIFPKIADDMYQITQKFLYIETDEEITGCIGPLTGDATDYYILRQIRPLLLGKNPLLTEQLWDLMYKNAPNGRYGDNMIAISYCDFALWDIKAKQAKLPLYQMLGGAVQDQIVAYVSTAGLSLEPDDLRVTVKKLKSQGFLGMKWFLRCGVGDGDSGQEKNAEIIRILRSEAGPKIKIMIDAWSNWGLPYTLKMIDLVERYDPAWIEEPLQYNHYDSYTALKKNSPIPIAGGEHEFTRWGAKNILDREMLDIYQFEPAWAGGMSEMLKINALVSTYDVTFIPHVYLPSVSAQVAFLNNASTTPMLEYHYILGQLYQFFLEKPLVPINGYFYPPQQIGLGINVDENKIKSEMKISL